MTNCPNCGAPVVLDTAHCPYCGTPYPFTQKPMIKIDADGITISWQQVENGIMTPNEARRALGLPEV